jgi:hypothetical protein
MPLFILSKRAWHPSNPLQLIAKFKLELMLDPGLADCMYMVWC